MQTFKCPKCALKVVARATEVAHRCPSNKSLMTQFKEEEKKEEK
jgi:phage FluMu protein Com